MNCTFEIDDLEKEWTWSRPFDYIFSRMMVGSFADFSAFTNQAHQYVPSRFTFPLILLQFCYSSITAILTNNQQQKKKPNPQRLARNNRLHLPPRLRRRHLTGHNSRRMEQPPHPSQQNPRPPPHRRNPAPNPHARRGLHKSHSPPLQVAHEPLAEG